MKTLAFVVSLAFIFSVIISPAAAKDNRLQKVLASYYVWYGLPGPSGKWLHWNEGGHNPERSDGRGVPDTGTTDHPVELYDSGDTSIIKRHLQAAEKAGIDALVTSWWGRGDYTDNNFKALLKEAGNTKVQACIYYEIVPAKNTDPDAVQKTFEDFKYIVDSYGSNPAYFKHQGKPVIFVYVRALGQLDREQWTEVVRQLKAYKPVMLVADSRSPEWLDVFDALHEYNSVGQVIAKEDYRKQADILVSAGRERNRVTTVTVIPGYDDSNVGRKTPIAAPRQFGNLYRDMWSAAIGSGPDWVMICSFNEWHEGSEIEASREYGEEYIALTSEYSRCFKNLKNNVSLNSKINGKISADDNIIVSASDHSDGVRVSNLSNQTGGITYQLPGALNFIVFEIGTSGKPYQRVDTDTANSETKWQARPYTSYLVYDRSILVRSLLSQAEDITGHRMSGLNTVEKLINAAKVPEIQSDSASVMQIHEAVADLVGVHARVSLLHQTRMPDVFKLCVDRAFVVECTVSNSGEEAIQASLSKLMLPDDWRVKALDPMEFIILPKSSRTWRYAVTVPVRTIYDKPYPISAWWDISSGTRSFTIGDNASAVVVHPFDREVTVTAGSPTEAELALTLRNNFPGLSLRGLDVEMELPEGWQSAPESERLTLEDTQTLKFQLTKPADDEKGLRVAAPIFTLGKYRGSKRMITDLHVVMNEQARSAGLWMADVEDGQTELTKRGDQTCRHATEFSPGQPCYIYFGVSENLPVTGKVYVTVSYFDEGTDTFQLQYDSADPAGGLTAAYKQTADVQRTNTLKWKTFTFALSDARFNGGQNGQADFRIASYNSGLSVAWVSVSKFPAQIPK